MWKTGVFLWNEMFDVSPPALHLRDGELVCWVSCSLSGCSVSVQDCMWLV